MQFTKGHLAMRWFETCWLTVPIAYYSFKTKEKRVSNGYIILYISKLYKFGGYNIFFYTHIYIIILLLYAMTDELTLIQSLLFLPDAVIIQIMTTYKINIIFVQDLFIWGKKILFCHKPVFVRNIMATIIQQIVH